jgi:hypothetical protein
MRTYQGDYQAVNNWFDLSTHSLLFMQRPALTERMISWLLLLAALYIGYRYLLAPPSTSRRQQQRPNDQGISNSASLNVNPQHMATLIQMFPQLSEEHLRLHLHRSGSLERVIDAILSGQLRIPDRPVASSVTSGEGAPSAPQPPAVAASSKQPVTAEMIKNGWLPAAEDRQRNFQLRRDFMFQQSRRFVCVIFCAYAFM